MSRSRRNFAGRPSRALAGMVCALAMSAQMLWRKMMHIAETDAAVVATANPGRLPRLRLGARLHALHAPVVHPIQLLAGAYE